jgi:hypothetical protein
VAALRFGEAESREHAPRLGRIVVGNGGLEMLPCRRPLGELPPEPAEKADLGLGRGRRSYHGTIVRLARVNPWVPP